MSKRLLLLLLAITFAFHTLAASRLERLIPDAEERRAVVHVLELIAHGGPFSHRQDGVVFQNRERRLPAQARGYYHEYTVQTPGASNRGARRIIAGSRGERYYTRDHYGTFVRVDSAG
jgi:guanyl-specific ribonuclease Sa